MTEKEEIKKLRAKASEFMSKGKKGDFDAVMEAIKDLEAETEEDDFEEDHDEEE